MGILSKDKNLVKLYYHSNTSLGKQTLGYVKSTEKSFLPIDIKRENLTDTQWAAIAQGLNINISDLIDSSHPNFTREYGSEQMDLDEHHWLKILEKHPEVLAFPIALIGNKFFAITNPSDFNSLLEDDSAGLEKPYKQ